MTKQQQAEKKAARLCKLYEAAAVAFANLIGLGNSWFFEVNHSRALDNYKALLEAIDDGRVTRLCECSAFSDWLAHNGTVRYLDGGTDPLLWEWGAHASPFGRCSCKDR